MLEDLNIGPRYDGFLFLAESVRNPPVLRLHHHLELELNVVAQGSVTYIVAGQRYTFPQRSLLWFWPSQEHQLVDRTPDAQYYVAVFKPEMIQKTCREPRYRALQADAPPDNRFYYTDLTPTVFSQLCGAMRALVADGLDPDLLNREAGFGVSSDFTFEHNDPDWLNASLRHFLLWCWRLQAEGGSVRREQSLHPGVQRALELLSRDNAPAELSELARQCAVSPSYLCRLFHKQMGITLSHYRNSIKLTRFWEYYRAHTHASFMECAIEAGFGSYAQFYRVYSQAYGEGPRQSLR